jgi:antitoxin component YwqK of YwqJK toxin-antitoxin module
MKPALLLCSLLATLVSYGQKIEKFYDYHWEPVAPNEARFYSLITKTDSGWYRLDYYIHERSLQMKGLFEDSACKVRNGYFYFFYPNHSPSVFGRYLHGKKEGTWFTLFDNGTVQDSAFYHEGNLTGTHLRWYENGYPQDSAVFNADGSGVEISWFDNGNPSSAGRYAGGYQQQGTWQYFHKNGRLSAQEKYDHGKLVGGKYFDEQGIEETGAVPVDRKAEFKGGQNAWARFLGKKLYFPSQYKFINGDKAVVIVSGEISEEGKMENVKVTTSLAPTFDRIALKTVQSSPDWIPAMNHNRKVKFQFSQPVVFNQPSD